MVCLETLASAQARGAEIIGRDRRLRNGDRMFATIFTQPQPPGRSRARGDGLAACAMPA
jgi:hypothetical protein